MTPERLDAILNRLGAVVVDGDVLCPCPVHQPDCDEPHRFKCVLSPGNRYYICAYCRVCEGEKGWLAKWYTAAGTTSDELSASDPDDVKDCWVRTGNYSLSLWGGVVGSAPTRTPIATDPILDAVYTDLLHSLTLTPRHAKWLAKRGLEETEARALGYRSGVGGAVRDEIGELLRAKWGDRLDAVPGFGDGRFWLRGDCVVTPVRSVSGQVVALKQRMLDGNGARLRWLAGGRTGAKNVNRCHCPLGVGGRRWGELWVTEGERKADVYWTRSGRAVVGVPGSGAWRTVAPVVDMLLAPGGVVVLALDRDGAGERSTKGLGAALAGKGIGVRVAQWDGCKGIDEAVVNGVGVTFGEYKPLPTEKENSRKRAAFPTPGDRVHDSQIVDYLLRYGPQLRDSVKCFPPVLSELIKAGAVLMRKSRLGQVVAARGMERELAARVREVDGGR